MRKVARLAEQRTEEAPLLSPPSVYRLPLNVWETVKRLKGIKQLYGQWILCFIVILYSHTRCSQYFWFAVIVWFYTDDLDKTIGLVSHWDSIDSTHLDQVWCCLVLGQWPLNTSVIDLSNALPLPVMNWWNCFGMNRLLIGRCCEPFSDFYALSVITSCFDPMSRGWWLGVTLDLIQTVYWTPFMPSAFAQGISDFHEPWYKKGLWSYLNYPSNIKFSNRIHRQLLAQIIRLITVYNRWIRAVLSMNW